MGHELTKNDIKKMEEEIEYRIHEVRKAALDDVKETRAQGDLSENFEYHAAKRFKNKNESRIRYLQRTIKNATVIDDSSADDEVGVNNTVEVFYEDDESTETIKIVTTIRADSLSGMISIESPLGKALLGHKKGDRVLVQVNPQVEYYVVIKDISNTDDSDDNINVFSDTDNSRYTFEVCLFNDNQAYINNNNITQATDKLNYMLNNKSESAYRLLEALEKDTNNFKIPKYIEDAFKWIKN